MTNFQTLFLTKLTDEQATLLNKTYRDPDSLGYMGSVSQVFNAIHQLDTSISRKQVQLWLLAQPSYALAPPIRYKVQKERIIVYNKNDLGAADLAEFQPLSSFNNGIRFLLVYRNCFTKRIAVGFLKSKHAEECAKVFRDMLVNQIKFIPRTLCTDRGGEFLNPLFRGVCDEFKIKMFQPRKGKAVHAENAILYLKQRIYRYMRDTRNKRYIEILPYIVHHYNNTIRPSLGVAPNQVEAHNQFKIFHRMFGKHVNAIHTRSAEPRFSVGDVVRVRLEQRTFEKSYFPKYSTELYKVTKAVTTSHPPKYDVVAMQDSTTFMRLLERELLLVPLNVPTSNQEFGIHRRPPQRNLTARTPPTLPLPKRKMQTRRDARRER